MANAVSISPVARWWIKRRGGELWIWEAPIGKTGNVLIHTSFDAHDASVFHRLDQEGLVVWVHRDLRMFDIRIGWTPVTGFDVTWPGTADVLPGG